MMLTLPLRFRAAFGAPIFAVQKRRATLAAVPGAGKLNYLTLSDG
jgi:hypothetical protein